jgi:hypothetical protein
VPEFALQTIPGVEIARVGTWNTSTGTWVCTPADIQDAVRAAADPTFRTPVIKLGHTDPRFDGEPAFGVIKNIRASDDGQALLGDLTGVPAWLAEMMPTSYPSRSIEATMDVVTPQGARYGMVVNGLALLGVSLPAIQSLAQLRERLGVTEDVMAAALPEGVTAGASVFASVPAGEGAGVIVRASATIDQLIQAVKGWVTGKGLSDYCYVREVYTDRVILDDDQGRLWSVTWTEEGGNLTFGDPQAVMVEYVPVANTVAAAAALTAQMPLIYVRGQVAAAGSATGPITEGGNVPTLTERQRRIREALGLGEDVTAEEIEQAVLDKLQAPPAETQPQTSQAGQPPATTTDTGQAAPQGQQAAPQPQQGQPVAASGADPALDQIARLSAEVAEMRAQSYREQRTRVIEAALGAGKIKPAERGQWEADYDTNPTLATSILARLAPGTAVPVAAKGRTGDDAVPDEDAALWEQVEKQFNFNTATGGNA